MAMDRFLDDDKIVSKKASIDDLKNIPGIRLPDDISKNVSNNISNDISNHISNGIPNNIHNDISNENITQEEKIKENVSEENIEDYFNERQEQYLQQQLNEADRIIQETTSRAERLQLELEDIYNDERIEKPKKLDNPINISMSMNKPQYLVYRDENNQTQIETAAYYLGREDNKQRIINKDIVLKDLSKETVNQLIRAQIEIEILSKMKKRISKDDVKLQKRLQIKLDEQKEKAKLLDIRLSIISDMITNISNLLNE